MKTLIGLVIILALVAGNAHAEIGMASWYGHETGGNRTANGERWHPHGYTAASWNYKFGTKVLVTNLKNGKFVIVRINDRGPSKRLRPKRIIDLSEGSASIIGLLHSGITRVKVEVIR